MVVWVGVPGQRMAFVSLQTKAKRRMDSRRKGEVGLERAARLFRE